MIVNPVLNIDFEVDILLRLDKKSGDTIISAFIELGYII
jgi:hypothetical protein